ncbi:MAG: TolC family protein [Edaphocola sp.]
MKYFRCLLSLACILPFAIRLNAQTPADTLVVDLEQCTAFALQNSPLLQRSLLDKEITEQGIKSKLADWYPQLRFDGSYQHNFQLSVNNINGQIIKLGKANTSSGQLSLTQNIFTPDILLASSTAAPVRKQALQNVEATKIDLTVNVAKAFYDVLLTRDQIKVLDENIVRLERSLQDAYNQYEVGIVDKVDYKRATISLNNTKAERKTANAALNAKYAYLKMQMGLPDTVGIKLAYHTEDLRTLAVADTSGTLALQNRIEYQQLLTQKRLQELNYDYYKWQFAPTVSAYGNYNLNYINDNLSGLYKDNYPNSYAGIKLGVPIFQGMKRIRNIRQAKMQMDRVDLDLEQVALSVNNEVNQAIAAYKGYLNDYNALKENVEIARDVFNTIELQYKAGVKTYLEVITAQTDLRTAEINYNNALYQLLAAKYDLQRALGTVTIK